MELQHINAKLLLDGDLQVDLERLIEIFHTWIREERFDELLIDVADYRHVPNGPGVMLVAHEADYIMESTAGKHGLRYNRKAPLEGTNGDRLAQAFRAALQAALLLESHFASNGPLTFNRQTFELCVNDRALAPNTAETFAACKPDIAAFLGATFPGTPFQLDHLADPRLRFAVRVTLGSPFSPSAVVQAWKA